MRSPIFPAILSGLLVAACLTLGAWTTEGTLVQAYRNMLESRLLYHQGGLLLGYALAITPQPSLMAMYAHQSQGRHSAHILGLFQLVERSGSAVGPALAGGLLGAVGIAPTIAFFGLFTISAALLYSYTQYRMPLPSPGNS